MGAAVAKPNPPEQSEAMATSDLAYQGMKSSAENFMQSIRLAEPSLNTLGYHLTENRLISQETQLFVQTKLNSPDESEVASAISSGLGDQWDKVATIALKSLQGFFGQPVHPVETAVNDEYAYSFLAFENHSVVQYSLYIKRTSSKCMGTVEGSSQLTMMTCVCKGNVDYARVDPQTVISTLLSSDPEFSPDAAGELLKSITTELEGAAKIAELKRKLESGTWEE